MYVYYFWESKNDLLFFFLFSPFSERSNSRLALTSATPASEKGMGSIMGLIRWSAANSSICFMVVAEAMSDPANFSSFMMKGPMAMVGALSGTPTMHTGNRGEKIRKKREMG